MKQFIVMIIGICLGLPLQAQERLSLMLDWYINPDHAPIILAQEKGYFADQGLDVEIIAPADPTEPTKLVAAGKADLAISYQPQLHLHRNEGLPLLRVGTLIATPLTCLMVAADGPIQSLAHLKGRRVGFAVSGVQEAMLEAMVQKAGLSLGDIELINVNWSLTPALLSGQVDAVIGAFRNFELTQMRLEGAEGRCFYPEEEGLPAYDELIFIAKSEGLERDKLRRFLAAIELATQYMINHPQEAYEVFAASGPDLGDELNRAAFFDTLPRFALAPAALDYGRYARFEAFLAKAGLISRENAVGTLAIDLGRAP